MNLIEELVLTTIESKFEVKYRQERNYAWWTNHYRWKMEHGLIDESTAERLLGERKALCFTSTSLSQGK